MRGNMRSHRPAAFALLKHARAAGVRMKSPGIIALMDRSAEGVVSVERLIRLGKQGSLDGVPSSLRGGCKGEKKDRHGHADGGTLPTGKEAHLFFQFVSARYEKSSIITSNKSFIDWQELFGDQAITSAIVDRLLHHCRSSTSRGTATGSRGRPSHSSRTNNGSSMQGRYTFTRP